ncbi:Peptide methionine sulfoxide reductase [Mycena venus]|uniref:Peptide methionine sulfoxide reductase n=1 Tax=Mycena venus TaxID=2733690 RepID=A0A8H6YR58_9AGAR|nr:Peptide methionine sulfoxide reductase [Mycena venus]
MDSQLTLVDPSPPVCLTFSANSMINAILYRDGRPVYTISTELLGSTTEIKASATSELLARITRKELLPDIVTFPNVDGGKDMRLSKWMRRCKLPDGSHAHVIETEVGNCLLRKHRTHRLALFTEYDLESPVAHWERPDESSPLSLILYSGTENFHPQIITAFTVQELKMRMAEKADIVALSRATAQSRGLRRGNM